MMIKHRRVPVGDRRPFVLYPSFHTSQQLPRRPCDMTVDDVAIMDTLLRSEVVRTNSNRPQDLS